MGKTTEKLRGEVQSALQIKQQAVKQKFDPKNILNPGRFVYV